MKKINKKIKLSGILIIVFFVLLVVLVYLGFNLYSKTVKDLLIDNLEQEVSFKAKIIDRALIDLGNDVLFLSQVPPIQGIIRARDNKGFDEVGDSSYETWVDRLNDLFSYISISKQIYGQFRYIDENGNEMARVDFKNGNAIIISRDDLQNKADRYYFGETIKLNKGEVFISPLDLNVEHGEIKNRGSEENPSYVPVIRYATPVFDDLGNSKGIIIINVYAEFFLREIKETNKKVGEIFLINGKGFYLAHSNTKKEFEFMFDKEASFYKDYPEIAENILANAGQNFLETDDLFVSFKYIYPTFRNLEIKKGEEINFQGIPKENHFWVLVIVLPKNEISYFGGKNENKK